MVVYPAEFVPVSQSEVYTSRIHGEVYTIRELFLRIQQELQVANMLLVYGIHCMDEKEFQGRLSYHHSVVSELLAHLAELTSR